MLFHEPQPIVAPAERLFTLVDLSLRKGCAQSTTSRSDRSPRIWRPNERAKDCTGNSEIKSLPLEHNLLRVNSGETKGKTIVQTAATKTYLESCKPHQPVQSVMVWRNKARSSLHITWDNKMFVFFSFRQLAENVFSPCTVIWQPLAANKATLPGLHLNSYSSHSASGSPG